MVNFVLLYHGGKMPETPEEGAAVMQAWTTWFSELGDAVVDGGNPATGWRTIASNGTVTTDAAGPTGYSIIKADSLDAAVALAKGCPVFAGGASVQVVETTPVM
ncbi:MAG: hypothetical protein LH650_09115 [Chloroflexi bacterium]|nr:hypothetical protein [Chloroflexota bacterium]